MLLDKWNWKQRLGLFFDADTGNGGGGDNGDDADTDDGTGDQDDSDAGQVEFTPEQQARIDALIAKRLARAEAKSKAKSEAAAQKAKDEAERARLADEKRWQELAEKRETELGNKEAELSTLASTLQDERIRHAVAITASGLHFRDPQDAFQMIDLATIETDDDGAVQGVKEALAVLAKAKPYLLEPEDDTGAGLGSPPSGRRRSGRSKLDDASIRKVSRL